MKNSILFLLLIASQSCAMNYYWYSEEAASKPNFTVGMIDSQGRTIPFESTPFNIHTKAGVMYTFVCHKKADADSYLWEDKALVLKERQSPQEKKNNQKYYSDLKKRKRLREKNAKKK